MGEGGGGRGREGGERGSEGEGGGARWKEGEGGGGRGEGGRKGTGQGGGRQTERAHACDLSVVTCTCSDNVCCE
jgi:hypothetical protein